MRSMKVMLIRQTYIPSFEDKIEKVRETLVNTLDNKLDLVEYIKECPK